MAQHRNTISLNLSANNYPALQQCLSDTSYRVLIFCTGEAIGTQDIAFPHQSEIRVNGNEIKANLRGLKNKPGSTRPVDITHALKLKPPNCTNIVDFTYALTTKASIRGSCRFTRANFPPRNSTYWQTSAKYIQWPSWPVGFQDAFPRNQSFLSVRLFVICRSIWAA